ncbi:peptide ABC transporter substrate-binding protein [Dictyobacter kobayashii]|uniref:ABC transporter substrate-binding protein n=1 Tax=Dictyobacter kobayashii TaxID=2014872 RepID=A0A402AGJ3_9CHLR|nr:peptide ABC transporter substrate-binding protein [Dictyobacter kobayashii]GCE18238.1 ABC transporter substrate-binding protein [Dictyobacter kobayashii]
MVNRPTHPYSGYARRATLAFTFFSLFLTVLAACGGSNTGTTSAPQSTNLAQQQVLNFPNVGINDLAVFDPAQGPDGNSAQAVNMIYSGLVKNDQNLKTVPDQATWQISSDQKVYTFKLNPNVTFSDGTQVTAQSYVYTWTRALQQATASPIASFFMAPIVGADAMANNKAQTLTGVKAIDDHTLQVTLTKPTPYFLSELSNSLFFPLNQKVIEKYGKLWTQNVASNGVGTGPFMVKDWQHSKKLVLVPNPHYYGKKTRLTQVNMLFVVNPATALQTYLAGQYDFVWNISSEQQVLVKDKPGFVRKPLLQSDLLFFDNTKEPFNKVAVRQAFAYATDKETLVKDVFKDTVTVAPTIIPPGMPGYQPGYAGLAYDANKAKALLKSAYPDLNKIPRITFSYPSSQVSANEASVLQSMWQNALGIQVKLEPVELSAYNDRTSKHEVQFGFTQWGADFPDPYDWLTLNLTSNASNNNGQWSNAQFDQTVKKAEQVTDQNTRLQLYNQAEQIAVSDVGWLPIDHQALAAVIPSWIHGLTLNGNGLYFGDWSNIYILQH